MRVITKHQHVDKSLREKAKLSNQAREYQQLVEMSDQELTGTCRRRIIDSLVVIKTDYSDSMFQSTDSVASHEPRIYGGKAFTIYRS